jgi:hypothetical protein
MSMVRRTLWEFLQGKTIDYYMDRHVEGLPTLETENGQHIQACELSFFMVGDRFARICLTGQIVERRDPVSTTVYYDSWEQMPDEVAEVLTRHFEVV